MNTENTVAEVPQEKTLTLPQKVGKLSEAILFVIQGLRSGSIKSKPILLTRETATVFETVSLESELWKALNACGIKEASK